MSAERCSNVAPDNDSGGPLAAGRRGAIAAARHRSRLHGRTDRTAGGAATGVNGESYKKGSPLSPRACWRRNGNPAGLAERRGSAAPLIQRESCGEAAMATRASGRVFRAKKKAAWYSCHGGLRSLNANHGSGRRGGGKAMCVARHHRCLAPAAMVISLRPKQVVGSEYLAHRVLDGCRRVRLSHRRCSFRLRCFGSSVSVSEPEHTEHH
jgi:hypothetical protein